MRWLSIVAICAGCADVPDSDVDGDGIADADDDCIAGAPDETLDYDKDGKDATQDLCPHDTNAVAGDNDFDGIPEACDPFPVDMARKDTRRCVTSFGVRWMNASYLVGRAGEAAWDLTPPLNATTAETASIVSVFEKQYKSTTYDLVGSVQLLDASATFTMLVRADPDGILNKDVGCGMGDGQLFVQAQGGRHALVPLPLQPDGPFRMRATINPTIVLCRITMGTMSMSTTYSVTAPRGLFGFRSEHANVVIDSLVTDSNETPPPI